MENHYYVPTNGMYKSLRSSGKVFTNNLIGKKRGEIKRDVEERRTQRYRSLIYAAVKGGLHPKISRNDTLKCALSTLQSNAAGHRTNDNVIVVGR